ncbi:Protein of unknown function (DUF3540) [Variovorax sp. CF313]|jgi:hypothetical protein|uniref:DUF3540 domain-containing protein n=1 Tax=Variovorax sp. CF313 TaxID=1144315 RepID=UPI0002713E3A|nr:DUF3540 domain-containing protein [Variovorax sp. CF313]EJL76655.1 Protein of unknown function (DUF3540) [Variovorax sp. CF313]
MKVVPLIREIPAEAVPVHFMGKLVACLPDGRFGVEDENGVDWSCRRAASCLLKPELGDTVLLSGPDRHRVYLIAVIEQADASSSCIDAPGDLVLGGNAGTVSIASASGVHLHSGGKLEMNGAQWALQAGKADCRIDDMRYTGQVADATLGRLRLVGKTFETVADRIVQMARTALRMVDEIEQVRVGHLDCEAADTVRIHGKHTAVTGKDLVKVDAAQIHMG